MNRNLFRKIQNKLNKAGLPVTRESVEMLWQQMKDDTQKMFDLLNEIHSEIFPPAPVVYEAIEDYGVSKRAPMVPLGEANPAFPPGYFASFSGRLPNGELDRE